ncbi:MAG: tryptophan synthase alpha chain [Micavibrio sp.]|nr:MAG: tryptophan synthase alpha chain [Micavibrio sp.]
MNRIEKTFAALKRPALVSFITAGDPDRETSQAVLDALPEAGADIIELGMPFSDPMADGPVIQAASGRALQAGADMKQTLSMVQQFREKNDDTPIVLMGYFNPVLAYGVQQFAKDASAAGVDGMIIVDLPPEEDEELQTAAKANGLDIIRLITPTTDESRLKTLLNGASGFLYYVSITGVTGTASANMDKLKPHIVEIKKHTKLPIVIGFGIKTPDDAAAMGQIGDAVVVGSSIVQTIENNDKNTAAGAVSEQVKALSEAL